MEEFRLGDKVQISINKFTGIITAIYEDTSGFEYKIEPEYCVDGKVPEFIWAKQDRLTKV